MNGRDYYRQNRTHESKIWYEPVKEKKAGPGKGKSKKVVRLKGVPQYKLFTFISKHFNGNVSAAAREFGIKQVRLFNIVSKGVLKRSVIESIVSKAKEIDPSQTEKSLFIPPKLVEKKPSKPAERRVINSHAPAIKPSMGGFVSIGTSPLSAAIARVTLSK